MAADGHTKRRILLTSMRYSLRAQSAPLVRGSSRRIMTLRFRPAHIRVINRRFSSTAAICSSFQNRKGWLFLNSGRASPNSNQQQPSSPKFISGLTQSLHIRRGSTSKRISCMLHLAHLAKCEAPQPSGLIGRKVARHLAAAANRLSPQPYS